MHNGKHVSTVNIYRENTRRIFFRDILTSYHINTIYIRLQQLFTLVMIMDVIIGLIIRLILFPIWLWWLGVLISNTHFVYGANVDESNCMLNSDNKQQLQQIQLEEMEEGGDEL